MPYFMKMNDVKFCNFFSQLSVQSNRKPLPKPGQLEDMEKFCRILSKPFPHVRVDFYEVHNKVYFGEMTFTPGGGLNFFTDEFFMEMGEQLDLSRVKRKGEA